MVRDKEGAFWKARIKGKLKIDEDISSTNPIAVGDIVEFDDEEGTERAGIIREIKDRHNYIIRVSPHNRNQKHIVAANLDLALLEVGLGGRLDAVNIVDADVAVITTVDLDHQDYLGTDRESIGAEKAGILRAGRPCVLAECDPPSSVLQAAYRLGAPAIRGHSDYLVERGEAGWIWREPGYALDLPLPALDAPAQLDNAAAAIAALRALPLEVADAAIRAGVASARVPGRLQCLQAAPELVLDVAHNPQAAAQLADWLQAHRRPTRAVFSALADKDIEAIAGLLDPWLLGWHVAGIGDAGARGLDGAALAARMATTVAGNRLRVHDRVGAALAAALAESTTAERVLVFGSFHTVADALRAHAAGAGRV